MRRAFFARLWKKSECRIGRKSAVGMDSGYYYYYITRIAIS